MNALASPAPRRRRRPASRAPYAMGTVTSCCTPPTVARTATALAETDVTAAASAQSPRALCGTMSHAKTEPDGTSAAS